MTLDSYDSAPPRGSAPPWTRVYKRGSRHAHLVTERKIACREPIREDAFLDDSWLGTGSQDEYEHAAALPLCPACFRVRETSYGGEGG